MAYIIVHLHTITNIQNNTDHKIRKRISVDPKIKTKVALFCGRQRENCKRITPAHHSSQLLDILLSFSPISFIIFIFIFFCHIFDFFAMWKSKEYRQWLWPKMVGHKHIGIQNICKNNAAGLRYHVLWTIDEKYDWQIFTKSLII